MSIPVQAAPTHAVQSEGLQVESAEVGRKWIPGWFVILWRNRKCRIGLVMLAVFVLAAVFAPLITPADPRADDFARSAGPSAEHWLGTTAQGEDVWSQLVYGARASLIVGVVAGLFCTVIGLVIGLVAGYKQGWVDEVLSFFINLG